jgi:hypothetical protein
MKISNMILVLSLIALGVCFYKSDYVDAFKKEWKSDNKEQERK